MYDTSGHDAPQPDAHTVTLRELEQRVAAAGVLTSRRQLTRLRNYTVHTYNEVLAEYEAARRLCEALERTTEST